VRLASLVVVLLALLASSCKATTLNYAGCASYWDSSSFPIIVSPDETFTAADNVYVVMAVAVWNSSMGREVFVVVPRFLQTAMGAPEGIALSHSDLSSSLLGFCPSAYYPGLAGKYGRVWRAGCLVDRAAIDNRTLYTQVIIHELGHALGFGHDEEIDSWMHYTMLSNDHRFFPKHVDAINKMMDGRYKNKISRGVGSCF
jgi:hypothetical protein